MAVKNKEVNLTAVLWPSQVGTVTYIWWIGNNTEVTTLCELVLPFYARVQLSKVLTPLLENGRVITFGAILVHPDWKRVQPL